MVQYRLGPVVLIAPAAQLELANRGICLPTALIDVLTSGCALRKLHQAADADSGFTFITPYEPEEM